MAAASNCPGDPSPAGEPNGGTAPRRPSAHRWPHVVVIVLCLAVGGVVVERVSRPPEPAAPEWGSREGPASEGSTPADDSPSAARLTLQELLDESRQLAARLETLPESAEASNLAGSIYEAIHDADKAMGCWERTLKVRPDSPEVHFNLGYAAWQVGNFDKAKSHFLKSHALNPDLRELRYYLADSLLKLGEADQAIRILEGADFSQLSAKARCVLGHAYVQGGDFEKAKKSFEAVLVLDPNHRDAHFGLIEVMTRLHEPDSAKIHRDAVVRLQQAEQQSAMESGRPREVAQIANDAGYVRRRLAVFYRSAAEVYHRLGREPDAEQSLRRGAALGADDPEYVGSPQGLPRQ